jgi:endogenous inhibitor of DNA gyrase (YacG/DUF329 family)
MIKAICPICKQSMAGQSRTEWPEFPFCSRRCKMIDLGRWLGEAYRLPAEEGEEQPDPEESEVP